MRWRNIARELAGRHSGDRRLPRDAAQEIAGELLNREADGGGDSLEALVTDWTRLSWL